MKTSFMDRNIMTGDPNQKCPSSVFGFDPYPMRNLQQNPQMWSQNAPNSGIPNYIPFYNSAPTQQPVASPFTSQSQSLPNSFSFGPQRGEESIVQFPFNISTNEYGNTVLNVRGKRKTDSDSLQPRKQHITEEKMADYMSKLHINSETAASPMESDSVRERRLYMCEEMRKLQQENMIPSCLLAKMQSPCTALVLWKPPTRMLPPLLGDHSNSNQSEVENNNSERAPDHNVLENHMENELEMENDVLGVQNNMDMDA